MSNIDTQKVVLGSITLMLSSALIDTLVILSKSKPPNDISWLDEMEKQFIYDIKMSTMEGGNAELELKAMNESLSVLKACFNYARSRITGNPEQK
jgi:hypothetical protein